MFNWLKQWCKDINDHEAEMRDMGVINVLNPYSGIVTYIDQEQMKKYIDDKQRAISKDNTKS